MNKPLFRLNTVTQRPPKGEQILAGAMQIFLESGYRATSMDRVAAVAGVSKQTIYSHFQDKQGLFVALIERVTIRQIEAEFGTAPYLEVPEVFLPRLARAFLSKVNNPEYLALLRTVIAESGRFPELAELYTQTVAKRGLAYLTEYFQAQPQLQLVDAEAAARIFVGALVAFIISNELLLGKNTIPLDPERLVVSLVDLILKGRLKAQDPS